MNFKMLISYFDRYFDPVEVRRFSIAVLLLGFGIILFSTWQWTLDDGKNLYGTDPGADYACFYVAGSLLNDYPGQLLYDFDLQSRIYHELLPGVPSTQELPFVNPPFFALLFKPLASLPYIPSYVAWIALSFAFYSAGIILVSRTSASIPDETKSAALLLALSFTPFLLESAIGGNSSSFGFFAVALAVFFIRQNNALAAGIALALCFYKPTLLILLLPMIVIARQGRVLLGMFVGGLVLATVSLQVIGLESSFAYIKTLLRLSQSTSGAEEIFRIFKYVDLQSFSRMLFGPASTMGKVVFLAVFPASLIVLIYTWWTKDQADSETRDLVWAASIAATLVLNVHIAIYDSIHIVIVLMLIADVLYKRAADRSIGLRNSFRWLVFLVYTTAGISQPLARSIGFQPYTLVLLLAVIYPLWLLYKRPQPVVRLGHAA